MEQETGLTTTTQKMNQVTIFADPFSFEQAQRFAKALMSSNMIPVEYQNNLPNALIAMEYANRLKISPLMVMQNLNIIHGRPSWGASYLIGTINTSGKYNGDLMFKYVGEIDTDKRGCIAWTHLKDGKTIIESPVFTIKMAKDSGLFDKKGSKWQITPELMLCYRAASMFARLYCPEITLGMYTTEELIDLPESEFTIVNTAPLPKVNIESLNSQIKSTETITEEPKNEPAKETPTEPQNVVTSDTELTPEQADAKLEEMETGKRKRRTKEQIAADKLAAEQQSGASPQIIEGEKPKETEPEPVQETAQADLFGKEEPKEVETTEEPEDDDDLI